MSSLEKTNNVVLKGDYEEAVYKQQLLPEYKNNPFLEALPPIFNEDDVLDRFMVTPRISKEDKQKDINIRYHVLKRVKNFIQPLPIHFEVERRLSTLIRRGYLARNPLDKTFLNVLKYCMNYGKMRNKLINISMIVYIIFVQLPIAFRLLGFLELVRRQQ